MRFKLEGLYAITDEVLTPNDEVVKKALVALEAGVNIIQYRNKSQSDDEVEFVCVALQEICRNFNVPFIIDDRPHLAQKIGADGLHIGKDDTPLSEARAIFTQGIIGVSCYGSVAKAKEAQAEGADYVAFGSFFASPTKPKSGIVSKSVIKKAKAALSIPVCVIGGINLDNVNEVVEENPDMISVVSAIFDGDIKENVQNLLQKMSLK
jgi:thiamine-phosphate pyrophosphorylase